MTYSPNNKAKSVWQNMKQRCLNPNNPAFPRYGGRGISICDRWSESFALFLEDMGQPVPGLTIDRINNDGNYEPGNCRWATYKEQAANQTRGGFVSKNHSATHCIRGHEFSAENTYIDSRGSRRCRECQTMHDRARRIKEKSAALAKE